MADELTELTSLIPTFTDFYTNNSHANTNTSSNATLSTVLTEACITSATAAAASIHSLVLWAYKDVLDLGKELVNKTQQAANKANKASKANKNKKGSRNSQESQEEEENEDEDGSATPEKAVNKVHNMVFLCFVIYVFFLSSQSFIVCTIHVPLRRFGFRTYWCFCELRFIHTRRRRS